MLARTQCLSHQGTEILLHDDLRVYNIKKKYQYGASILEVQRVQIGKRRIFSRHVMYRPLTGGRAYTIMDRETSLCLYSDIQEL